MRALKLPAFLTSPFFTFCIPPSIFIFQFLMMNLLLTTGFPDVVSGQMLKAALLIIGLFSLTFFTLLGAGWGIRQVFMGEHKIASAFGAAFNGLYFLAVLLFYIAIFITNATN